MRSALFLFVRFFCLLTVTAAGVFILLSYSPVDPIRAYIGNDLLHVPPEQYPAIAARWGLDQPLWQRFWIWFSQMLRGDLGAARAVTGVAYQRLVFLGNFRAAAGAGGRAVSEPLAGQNNFGAVVSAGLDTDILDRAAAAVTVCGHPELGTDLLCLADG